MRRLTTLTFAASLAVASIGCETATNTNVANKTNLNANSNLAVVVNNNSNMMMNSNMGNSNRMNSNISRADYDRDRAKYEADKGTSTVGQGANDSWLWFKTKGALATTNDLRDSTINVDVSNDIVTLRGTVATKAEMEKAVKVAQEIDGVKSVKNMLKVNAADSMTNQATTDDPNMKSNANKKN
ncbi:MAG: BON domain-containing protein [Pyrinomonadaceae bacterium]